MKCQSIFAEKNKKNIIDLSFADFAHREVKVQHFPHFLYDFLQGP